MKNLSKIKLNNISAENLSAKQMKEIKGGSDYSCLCSCFYEGTTHGSSSDDNCWANHATGTISNQGDNQYLCRHWSYIVY